jgi:hypothetical protein
LPAPTLESFATFADQVFGSTTSLESFDAKTEDRGRLRPLVTMVEFPKVLLDRPTQTAPTQSTSIAKKSISRL